jgi:indole-3-glycerol phosphate synthase
MADQMMYLPEILANTRAVVAERKATADISKLETAAAEHQPRGFARALRERAEHGYAVIAELKKASPSKGLIRESYNSAALARDLEAGGAAALSVLTEGEFFKGSLDDLQRASSVVRIPCLRKDFIVDEFQVLEARANLSDAILLIVAALTDAELKMLRAAAKVQDLDVLCEVHDEAELERALALDCECIGVNSRDLNTFEVSLERTLQLAEKLPKSAVRVAESGIQGAADMQRLRAAGYEAFLMGETLMRQSHPGGALASLLREARK